MRIFKPAAVFVRSHRQAGLTLLRLMLLLGTIGVALMVIALLLLKYRS